MIITKQPHSSPQRCVDSGKTFVVYWKGQRMLQCKWCVAVHDLEVRAERETLTKGIK